MPTRMGFLFGSAMTGSEYLVNLSTCQPQVLVAGGMSLGTPVGDAGQRRFQSKAPKTGRQGLGLD